MDIKNELSFNIKDIETIKPEDATSTEPMEDFFELGKEDIDNFNANSWKKGEGFKLPNFQHITKNLEGLDSGLYLFAGKSNHGKSAMMMNMMHDACYCEENKLFGIYFSLDDSKNEIIPRIVAMDQSIPIGVVSKPQRYQNMIDNAEEGCATYIDMLEKREIGLQKMRDNSNKMKIEDTNKIKNIDDMYSYIKRVVTYLHAIDENYRIIMSIDSINDVVLGRKATNDDTLAEIARTVKHWSVEFDCPIFASTHIRKLNGKRRPTLDDLKDSTVLVYEASTVWIVYNDVSENKQGANIFQKDPAGILRPILELDWAKNKKSSYKGNSFCFFTPEYSKAIECDEQSIERYSTLIRSV